ncbi:MAG: ATP synthase F1 subunit gamma [Acidobacteria bacterium]|nr:ATP synthase F1 subunit gamma [Acidobacteriota bacterium]
MPSTLDIRRRIRSVKNTQQITKAMKMVAAAKLRRAQDRIVSARPYAGAISQILASVASRVNPEQHPLLAEREEKRVLLLVVTGDKGLAGAFNGNIFKATFNAMRERGWSEVQLIPIGRKASEYFRRRTVPIRLQAPTVFQALSLKSAGQIANVAVEDFTEDRIDAVYAVYNEFRSIISQVVRVEKLLPIERAKNVEPTIDYLYEPSPEQILKDLIPKHLEFQIYKILLDSAAAEQGARMTAMEAATKNAADMIDSLTLSYNRIRQAAITKEIIEIVSGAAALD